MAPLQIILWVYGVALSGGGVYVGILVVYTNYIFHSSRATQYLCIEVAECSGGEVFAVYIRGGGK